MTYCITQDERLFVKNCVLTHSQHTVSTHLTGGPFTPPSPHHLSLLKSKHKSGVWSRFFHSDPQMKELILCFFTPSPPVTSAFQPARLTHIWTDRCKSFHFLSFSYETLKLLETRLKLHKKLLSSVRKLIRIRAAFILKSKGLLHLQRDITAAHIWLISCKSTSSTCTVSRT